MRFKTRLKINFSILEKNFKKLKEMAPRNQILFMVKSNAYGHGIIPVVRFAVEKLNITQFGCATLGEALTLREELRDLMFEIYVFSDLELDIENGMNLYLENRIMPVISCREHLLTILGEPRAVHLPLCLKFDTGMNRLGISSAETGRVLEDLKRAKRTVIYHLLSHFACASQSLEGNSHMRDQYERFQKIKAEFQAAGLTLERTSMANSGAIEQGFALAETHVRPGLILYGPSSLSSGVLNARPWKGESISSLETHIIHLKKIKKGETLGYGAHPCPEDGVLAYIALGYGDGITNFYGGIRIHHQGHLGKVVGRISMDMSCILFPREAESSLKLGDTLSLWNHDPQTVLELSDQISSIPYEVYCGISDRIPRIYQES